MNVLAMANLAMEDMATQIKQLRKARSNINRLIQSAPSDAPVMLLHVSKKMESVLRDTRTDMNLWIQKHFHGGEEWVDYSEQEEQEEENKNQVKPASKFNEGHDHQLTMAQGGMIHSCPKADCNHYSDDVSAIYPDFRTGHDERGRIDPEGNMIWYCPHPDCEHFAAIQGQDEVDWAAFESHYYSQDYPCCGQCSKVGDPNC